MTEAIVKLPSAASLILIYWTEEIKKIFNKVRPESVLVFIEQIKKVSLFLLY